MSASPKWKNASPETIGVRNKDIIDSLENGVRPSVLARKYDMSPTSITQVHRKHLKRLHLLKSDKLPDILEGSGQARGANCLRNIGVLTVSDLYEYGAQDGSWQKERFISKVGERVSIYGGQGNIIPNFGIKSYTELMKLVMSRTKGTAIYDKFEKSGAFISEMTPEEKERALYEKLKAKYD